MSQRRDDAPTESVDSDADQLTRLLSAAAAKASSQVQSTLLRLCLVCASSQATLREALPLDVRADPSDSGAKSKVTVPSATDEDQLRKQILNDIAVLLKAMQKHATALTLAMRPGKSASTDTSSPTSSMDIPSLQAALAQLTPLLSDVTPKLVFLSRKATQSRAVYQLPPQTEAQKQERSEVERKVKAAGGSVLFGNLGAAEQLVGKTGRQSAPPKNGIRLGGLGIAWANSVRLSIERTLDALAALADAFLDARTRKALDGAEAARLRKSGQYAPLVSADSNNELPPNPSREVALVRAKALNTACEEAIKALPKDNADSVATEWVTRAELMEDGLREVKVAIEAEVSTEDSSPADGETGNQDDGFGIFDGEGAVLSLEDRDRAKAFVPLFEASTDLHAALYGALLKSNNRSERFDLDKINSAARCLEISHEDLIATILYGEVDDDDDLEEDVDEDEDDRDGKDEDQHVDPNVLCVKRTFEEYVNTAEQLYEVSKEKVALDQDQSEVSPRVEAAIVKLRSAAEQVRQDLNRWSEGQS